MRSRLLRLLLLLCMSAGAQALELRVAAPSSLAEALRELRAPFEISRPGVTLSFVTDGSGALLQRLQEGAAFDVFVSADQETMNQAAAAGLLRADTRTVVTSNRLLLVSLADAPLRSLADLSQAQVQRIGIGEPGSVPAGRYARQSLQAAGLWDALQAKLLARDNVRAVLDAVLSGEADAAFVYRSDWLPNQGRLRVLAVLDGHEPIRYPAAVLRRSGEAALAQDYLRFLLGPQAQAVLKRRGFSAP